MNKLSFIQIRKSFYHKKFMQYFSQLHTYTDKQIIIVLALTRILFYFTIQFSIKYVCEKILP